MFKAAAWLIDTFYGWVNNYAIAMEPMGRIAGQKQTAKTHRFGDKAAQRLARERPSFLHQLAADRFVNLIDPRAVEEVIFQRRNILPRSAPFLKMLVLNHEPNL